MANIYINSDLELTLETNTDISGANTYRIYYKRPDNRVSYWTGTLSSTTKIVADIPDTDLTVAGAWQFYAWVEYNTTGYHYQGDPVYQEIRTKWQSR